MCKKCTKYFEMGKSNPKGAQCIKMHNIVKMSEWYRNVSPSTKIKNGAKRQRNLFNQNKGSNVFQNAQSSNPLYANEFFKNSRISEFFQNPQNYSKIERNVL